MDGKIVYHAFCSDLTCRKVWRFVEHRGIASAIVIDYLRENRCGCGANYGPVSVEEVEEF